MYSIFQPFHLVQRRLLGSLVQLGYSNSSLYYNTPYNLSIICTLCGQNTTEVIELHYGEWFHPCKSTGYDVSSLLLLLLLYSQV